MLQLHHCHVTWYHIIVYSRCYHKLELETKSKSLFGRGYHNANSYIAMYPSDKYGLKVE